MTRHEHRSGALALSAFVRATRESLGLSQSDAARLAGISKTTWQGIEAHASSTRTRNTTLHRTARALGVDGATLIALRDGDLRLEEARAEPRSREDIVDGILRRLDSLRESDLVAIEDNVRVRADLRRLQRAMGTDWEP